MQALPALLLLLAAAGATAAAGTDPSRLQMAPITLPSAAAGAANGAPPLVPEVEPERMSGYFKLNRT